MSARYVTLKWGSKEFGSFGVEDFDSERLAQALMGMVNLHLDLTEENFGPIEDRKDYYSASEKGLSSGGTPLVAGVVVHRPTGESARFFEVLKYTEHKGSSLEFCSKYLPPDLASGRRKITVEDIDAAVEQLDQEDEANRRLELGDAPLT